jgi:uncharacterized protein YdbL (DUF1318 family)
MKELPMIIVSLLVLAGCARITVDAPKDPIKLDVTMRLDIYQHIQSDIDDIENMVTGGNNKKAKTSDKHSFLDLIIAKSYAEDGFGTDVQEAVQRRKDRRDELISLEQAGSIGENKNGMVVVKGNAGGAQALVTAENADRRMIYQAVADKNGSSIDDVAKIYAKRLQNDAPSGTPIETDGGWQIK